MDVLIIDDEQPICEALTALLQSEGIESAFETEARCGLERAANARVVLLDLRLPGVRNLEVLEEAHRRYPRTPIVMITAHGTIRTAVEAMKRGAFDFIMKPPEKDELLACLRKALQAAATETSVSQLYYELPDEVVFNDPRSRELVEQVRKVAPTDLTVLIEGETGVGKEVFARLLHEWSPRAGARLIKIHCAAIPRTLFESELFGHEKGAFTGAGAAKPGRIELAEGGTLFLDEIGELEPPIQVKLLQFLQDKSFERVGGLRTLKADVRLVTATNRNLEDEVQQGRFRTDLFYRIAGAGLTVPPLRDRRGDIGALAEHFLTRFGRRYDRDVRLAPGALAALEGHAWPGNVRELEHGLARAVALAEEPEIPAGDILPGRALTEASRSTDESLRDQRREFERARILDVLQQTGGNRTRAAVILDISRRMLQKKLKDLGIQ
jgi:DNA-binding NtrC family response regulator